MEGEQFSAEQRAATKIQAGFRRHAAQRRFKRQQIAAKVVQARFRGWYTRKQLETQTLKRERATRFESVMRRHRERIQVRAMEVRCLREMDADKLGFWKDKREESARRIQEVWRKWKARGSGSQPPPRPLTQARYKTDPDSDTEEDEDGTEAPFMDPLRREELLKMIERCCDASKENNCPVAIDMKSINERYKQAMALHSKRERGTAESRRWHRKAEMLFKELEHGVKLDEESILRKRKPGKTSSARMAVAVQNHRLSLMETGSSEQYWPAILCRARKRETNYWTQAEDAILEARLNARGVTWHHRIARLQSGNMLHPETLTP